MSSVFTWFNAFLRPKYLLIAVVIAGAVLRLWGLGSAELFHDEGFFAFRSIGYLDYLQNDNQTTPVQWFKDAALPAWTNLSFHDHPPLFFFIQHFSFAAFGDSLFAARLPSAIAGIASLVLLFAIARRIFKSEYAGLAACFLLAINHIHIWISRSSLMESVLIFFILLNVYAFLRFVEDSRRWMVFGATLGAVLLTKYTGFFLIPVYAAYLAVYQRHAFAKKQLYGALLLVIVMMTPVIVYNVELFQARGHFDLQLSYLAHQKTPEWTGSLGKLQEPFSHITKNLFAMYSIPFLLAAVAGIGYSIVFWRKTKNPSILLGWLIVGGITLMLVAVGAAFRFISLYAPIAIGFVLLLFLSLKEKLPLYGWRLLCIGFIAYELIFTVQGIFIEFPNFGVVQLDQYLSEKIGNLRPRAVAQSSNPHLQEIIQAYLKKYPVGNGSNIIVYDENLGLSPRLWLFARRSFYHGIPSATTGQFKALLRSRGATYFKGYTLYFVKTTSSTDINPYFSTNDAAQFEAFLQQEFSLQPEKTIVGHFEQPMFYVYKVAL